ncbi:hypothetical protein M8J76_009709 [Diaphorina citri]|nr:hypothetical protein M8J76_009709 [Diaphorina citri]
MGLTDQHLLSSSPPHPNTIKNVFNGVQNHASRWFQHISKAADKAKSRRPDPSPISGHEIDAASSGDSPHSKTKETEESHSQNLSVPSNSSSVQSAQLNGPSVSSPDLITSKLVEIDLVLY